jgi:hypothetical protein
MCCRDSRLAVFALAALTVATSGHATRAQAVLLDDFSHGIFDGWTAFDAAESEPWGPGIVELNGKNELLLASGRPIPTREPDLVGAMWDAGNEDPLLYSEGTLRARLRVEEAATETGLAMRNSGSLATGFNNYVFYVEPARTGTRYCIRRVVNTRGTIGECVDGEVPLGEDIFLEASAVGTQLSLKYWPVDDPEPSSPQLTWSDSQYAGGTLGVYAIRSDNHGDYAFDSNFAAVYDDLTFTPSTANSVRPVPEPAGIGLATAACLGLLFGPWRRRNRLVPRSPLLLWGAVTLTPVCVQNCQAQLVFDLGTIPVSSENTRSTSIEIPSGTFNAYSLTTDWSSAGVDPWSEEAIWAIANGPYYSPETTLYVDPGPAPNSLTNSSSTTLEWRGMLELPLTGPLDAQLLTLQSFDEPDKSFAARWSNTVLELSYVTPAAPPRIDVRLGVVAESFSPLRLNTLGSDFDTELGVYSETGKLVAQNDDVVSRDGTASPASEVDFHLGLPAGDYFAVLGGFNTIFDDGFAVSPGTAGGNYTLSAAGVATAGSVARNEVSFVAFTVGSIWGDFDADGELSSSDIDLLAAAFGTTEDLRLYDVDDSGVIDPEDHRLWVEGIFGTHFGDADLDRSVDFSDFVQLANGYSRVGGWESGDFDGSGDVQFADFVLLSANFGRSTSLAMAAVPEPTNITLSLFCAPVWTLLRRRYRQCRQIVSPAAKDRRQCAMTKSHAIVAPQWSRRNETCRLSASGCASRLYGSAVASPLPMAGG